MAISTHMDAGTDTTAYSDRKARYMACSKEEIVTLLLLMDEKIDRVDQKCENLRFDVKAIFTGGMGILSRLRSCDGDD